MSSCGKKEEEGEITCYLIGPTPQESVQSGTEHTSSQSDFDITYNVFPE